jgi:hypothetical protein
MSENPQIQAIMLRNGNRTVPIRETYACAVCGDVVRSECWLVDRTRCTPEHCGQPMPMIARGWPEVRRRPGLYGVALNPDEMRWQDRLVSWVKSVIRVRG